MSGFLQGNSKDKWLTRDQKVTRNSKSCLHDSACTLPANYYPKWITGDEHIIEPALRGAGGNLGEIQRYWDFITNAVGIINLERKQISGKERKHGEYTLYTDTTVVHNTVL